MTKPMTKPTMKYSMKIPSDESCVLSPGLGIASSVVGLPQTIERRIEKKRVKTFILFLIF